MALSLDVGGSSTSAANISSGGNAGIKFAPKGLSTTSVAWIIAAVVAGVAAWIATQKKGK